MHTIKRAMRLGFAFFCICSFVGLHAKPLSVQVSAPSAILMNAETGDILYAKEIHEKKWPGSITKIATALYVLLKKGDTLNEVVMASREALSIVPPNIRLAKDSSHPSYRLETDGTSMGLRPGERASLLTLLHGLMLSSGNDAGNVLAEAVSGSVDRFMGELNLFLRQHGILETHFSNPHGLHYPDHWTTAYDMAQMTRLALKNPTFQEVVKTTRYLKPQPRSEKPHYLIQHNRLLKPGPYFYPKAIGVKTGYHFRAGYTFVGAATQEGRTLIAVVLQCEDSQTRFRDVIRLFEAAFKEKKIARTLFAKESDQFTHPIQGANQPLQAVLKDDMRLEYYPAEEPQFRAEIAWSYKDLPLEPGDVVGSLRCIDHKGNILSQRPVFAANQVSKTVGATVLDICRTYKGFFIALFLGSQIILLLVYFFKKQQKVRKR